MNQNFDDQSRVWIYTCNRAFTDTESRDINNALKLFCKEWTAHGSTLLAKGEIFYNRFIVLMVDETHAGASGCSIDKSVHFMQVIESEYQVQLFNRLLVSWKAGNNINVTALNDLDKLIENGEITEDTLVFNNTITLKKHFDQRWIIPLKESWLASRVSLVKG
ncbi:MAG: ABC transporter ATPase [Chitinophagales bacterium]|nr:ABC transporter ATPase [Chitinophagales bacterium]